ncbi:MAG: hypothetical protein J6M60_03295 [Clostridia bacterium]|nr:hypothetical protein [Clostridia bacterium]
MKIRMRRRKSSSGNRIKLSNAVRISLILLSIIIIAIGSGNMIKSLTNKTQSVTESSVLYKYDNKFSSDAKINLKDNIYVHEDEMIDGQSYLSDIISNIAMDIDYKYSASVPSQITYSYKIEAIMKASYTNTKGTYDVLNKIDTIEEGSATTDVASELSIKDKITINYAKYHQTMKEFKQTMGINTDSKLYVRFTIDTSTNINSKDVKNQYVADYKITIGDKIAIVEDVKNDSKSNIVKADEIRTEQIDIDYKGVAISLVAILIGIAGIVFVVKKTEELKSVSNEYKRELNRILKSYEDKIVEIQDINNFDIENATKVKDIIQLRKLAEEALVPIYCYMSETEAYFIVTKYENSYIFILK